MHFYILEHPSPGHDDALTDFLPTEDAKRGNAPRCPKCGGVIGQLQALPPFRVELETWGKRFGDLVFGIGNDVLVSEHFRDEFLRSGLNGLYEFAPVEIVEIVARRGKIPKAIPNYFYAVPGRSRAAIDHRKSEFEYERPWTCDECRVGYTRRFQRVVVEPNTWSGEDVFIARGLPGTIITSERFKTFCDRHAFSNCVLTEAERYHHDAMPWRRGPTQAPYSRGNGKS
jgi:hypothetical protein